MKKLIYNIYDSKSKSWFTPVFVLREGQMLRSWMDVANDESSTIGKHPEDYCLFKIGTFDDDTGDIKMLEVKESIGLALHFKRESPIKDERMAPIKFGAKDGDK